MRDMENINIDWKGLNHFYEERRRQYEKYYCFPQGASYETYNEFKNGPIDFDVIKSILYLARATLAENSQGNVDKALHELNKIKERLGEQHE